MKIDYLANHPEMLKVLAPLLHREWGHHNNERCVEDRIAFMQKRLNHLQVPTCFVAYSGEEVLGTASLVECDVDAKSELTPWLATLYVVDAHRGSGVGKKLVNRVMEEAKLLGMQIIYLATPQHQIFYAKLGWNTIENVHNHGEQTFIMAKKLT